MAKDPGTDSSSPGIDYAFTFDIPVPPNRPPVPAVDCAVPTGGRTITCAATVADPDFEDAHTLIWDFGDGTSGTGASVTHTFASYRQYVVSVTATDKQGATGTAHRNVDLRENNRPPVADFSFAASGRTVSFDARTLSTEPDGDTPLSYSWNFGDGTTGSGSNPPHTYAAYQSYDVTLTVTDTAGGQATRTRTVSLRENNRAPDVDFSCVATNLRLACTGTATDPDGDALQGFTWRFENARGSLDDGGLRTGDAVEHTFTSPGTKFVTLSVADAAGASGSRERQFTLTAPPPPPPADSDGDGRPNNADNCPQIPNADQRNTDGLADGGDACDNDDDNDGFPDETEVAAGSDPRNAASTPNNVDSDGDGFSDADERAAGSNAGDAASTPRDRDGDGRLNEADNCPNAANANQADADGDGVGDVCDPVNDGPNGDQDGDGVRNGQDNCPANANADQADLDKDGTGDACDSDIDGDGIVNALDAFVRDVLEWLDTDGDGIGDNGDPDDDNDLLTDAAEQARDSDPKDRDDPPFRAVSVSALPDGSGGAWVGFAVQRDPRVQAYLLWREASPKTLVATLPAGQAQYLVHDDDVGGASQWRYFVQAQLRGGELLFDAGASTRSNDLTPSGPVLVGCTPGAPDSDGDGICDASETLFGLDPLRADSDGDGRTDLDELFGYGGGFSFPNLADSDGDGVDDGAEAERGSDPFVAPASQGGGRGGGGGKGTPGPGLPTLLLALVACLAILRRRR